MPNEYPRFADREVLIVAIAGWSNAANATTLAMKYLLDRLDVSFVTEFDCENHVDLQVTRPLLLRSEEDGMPFIHYPNFTLLTTAPGHTLFGDRVPLSEATGYVQHLLAMNPDDSEAAANERITTVGGAPVTNLHLLVGTEPNSGWMQLSSEIADAVTALGVTDVIMLGSMMTDQPHTRPSTVIFTSESPLLQDELEIDASEYEGPIGFGKSLEHFLYEIYDVQTCAMWVSVPHYTHNLDSPRSAGALLDKLEETLDIVIPRSTLQKDIAMWDENVQMMINRDSNLAGFLRELENAYDARNTAENAGDELVREFEQFLQGQEPRRPDTDLSGFASAELRDGEILLPDAAGSGASDAAGAAGGTRERSGQENPADGSADDTAGDDEGDAAGGGEGDTAGSGGDDSTR